MPALRTATLIAAALLLIEAELPPVAIENKNQIADRLREAASAAGCEVPAVEITQADRDAPLRVVVRCRRLKEEPNP